MARLRQRYLPLIRGGKTSASSSVINLGIMLILVCSILLPGLTLAQPIPTPSAATSQAPVQPQALRLDTTQQKHHWHFAKGINAGQQLRLTGINPGPDTVRLLIRVDSRQSSDYFTRFNREHLIPEGAFSYTLALDNLRTERKQPMASGDLRDIFLTPLSGSIQWQQATIEPAPKLPDNLTGWDFGPEEQPLAAGFQGVNYPLSAEDQARGISVSGTVRIRNRPYFDPALADGFEGLTHLTLPMANGLWKVRLWVDDIGEWEYLPHALERSVTINGQPVLLQKLDSTQWLKQRYLNRPQLSTAYTEGAAQNSLQDAFWHTFAKERGLPLDALIEVRQQKLEIHFSSPQTSGRFISALIAAPANNLEQLAQAKAAFEDYQQRQFRQFREHWPVIRNPELERYLPPRLEAEPLTGADLAWADQEDITLRIRIPAGAGKLEAVNLPLKDLKLFRVFTGLRRAGGQEQALQPQRFLQPIDPEGLPRVTDSPEDWVLTGKANISTDALRFVRTSLARQQGNTGADTPAFGLVFSNWQTLVPVQPLKVRLPPADRPVGIYLDYAPHLSWLAADSQQQQADCDYKELRSLGLTGVAPALPTPLKGHEAVFTRAAQSPLAHGLLPPFPAYTPVKRLLPDNSQQSRDQAIVQLNNVRKTFPYLIWSLADEPGLHLSSDQKLDQFRGQLKQTLPEATTLAQLNHKHHDTLFARYDAVMINHGYGLSEERLRAIRQSKTQTYLYNLPYLRFASGLYLWRTGAGGFWQWHGRMPTAHPFDPTDGREDDVQMLLPSAELCQPPILHSSLLGIRQGVNDLRWMRWLMQNANQDIDSAILLNKIRSQISVDWDSNSKNISIKNNTLAHTLISQIKQLAQPVQTP